MRLLQKIALSPLALVYSVVLRIRHFLFNQEWIKSLSYDNPIIGIGNLSFGGTGKSPLTVYLAKLLMKHNFKVAIVSRGYGRKSTGLVLADEQSTASDIGDEPFMYLQSIKNITIAVSGDRNLAVQHLLKSNNKPDVILLDDSFQHRKIRPSLSLLLTIEEQPYWKDLLVPAGYLRDVKSANHLADALLITKSNFHPHIELPDHWRNRPVFRSKIQTQPPVSISGKSITSSFICFSGIAHNLEFQTSVSALGKVAKAFSFSDHHVYTEEELIKIVEHCNAETTVITTQKDYARLSPSQLDIFNPVNFCYLPIATEFENGEEFDTYILNHVNSMV